MSELCEGAMGTREWMSRLLERTVREFDPLSVLEGIREVLSTNRSSTATCDLVIQGLMDLRECVDGSGPAAIYLEVDSLREAGQKEYAHTDRFDANFTRVGNFLGVSPKTVLLVYLFKHLDGIAAYFNGHTSQREPVQGRINDAIVYVTLLKGMIECTKSTTF